MRGMAGVQMLPLQPDASPKGCAGCHRKIRDRFLLKALDKYWHEDCLKCACCDCRLGEVGSTLYTRANLILCRRDYLRCAMSNAISEKWCDGSIGIYCLAGHHFHNPQVNKNRCRSSRFGHNESRHVQPADLACGLLRLFGATGNCAACSKLIPAFEMVMRVRESVYHLDCFACQLCSQRFCVGDKFFLKNNMILCQSDYEETSAKETFPSPVPT